MNHHDIIKSTTYIQHHPSWIPWIPWIKARCPAFWWSLALWAFSEVTRTADKATWNRLPTAATAAAKGGENHPENQGETSGKYGK